ncbi:MAG: glycosyltransferase family 61 protein [Alphaproteobacteria bacterium]|nr:glycosyltransferase family 61 protein [Alphaproteobacteria bacterium]
MTGGRSDPWFSECDAGNLKSEMLPGSASKCGFDLDHHLAVVKNPNKRVVDTLGEVDSQNLIKKRLLTPLRPARGLIAGKDPFSPPVQIDTAFLLHLENAYAGDNVVFDQERYFSFGRWWAGDDPGLYSQTETIEHIEAGVLISAWGGSAFQLFILDALPPLAAVIELLETPGFEHIKIISHNKDAAFARWLWKRLGLSERVIEKPLNAQERHVVHCDQLLFPHYSPGMGAKSIYPRRVLAPIQKRLGLMDGQTQDLIVYADRSGLFRSVENPDMFLKPLETLAASYGLELRIFGGKGNWDEDLALFRRAKIVLGPHGAGLANIAFCAPGTHVIEFVPISEADFTAETSRWTPFYGLSQAAGHHFWVVEPEVFDFDDYGMQVDATEVLSLIHRILEEPADAASSHLEGTAPQRFSSQISPGASALPRDVEPDHHSQGPVLSGPRTTDIARAIGATRSSNTGSNDGASFDFDFHLAHIRDPYKQVINTLAEVNTEDVVKSRVLSPLHPARGVDAAHDPFSSPVQINTTFVLYLRDAYIGDNVVFDRKRYFCFGRWWAGDDPAIYNETETIEHIEAGVLVSGWMGNAFQHFILDALAPLASVIDMIESPGFERVKIVSHDRDAPFARWLWGKLGLQDRIVQKPISAHERHVVHCDHVLFPHFSPSIGAPSIYPRHALRPVQKRLGLLKRDSRELIIYADRQGFNRSVRDQERFLAPIRDLADQYGLELVIFRSNGDWDSDLSLFARARIVVGPHGAGLSNMAFCPPGTHVIEFVPISSADYSTGNFRRSHFYGLSQAAGHHYWVVEPEYFDFEKPDMRVDGEDVVSLVSQILADSEKLPY